MGTGGRKNNRHRSMNAVQHRMLVSSPRAALPAYDFSFVRSIDAPEFVFSTSYNNSVSKILKKAITCFEAPSPHSADIFDESICWVRPGRVRRFGFVDRQVMGSLSPVAGYIRRVHLLGSAMPSLQVRVRRPPRHGFAAMFLLSALAILVKRVDAFCNC